MNPAVYLVSLPNFLMYFVASVVLVLAFLTIFVNATPQSEMAGIREGKLAPAISLIGALIGFVLPLTVLVQHSTGLVDLFVWGVVAIVIQVVAFFAARLSVKDLCKRIDNNEVSAGVFAGGVGIVVGLLNMASMVP